MEAQLAKKTLTETSAVDQSAIGDIERPATEAIVSYDIATEDAVGKPVKARIINNRKNHQLSNTISYSL